MEKWVVFSNETEFGIKEFYSFKDAEKCYKANAENEIAYRLETGEVSENKYYLCQVIEEICP